VAERDLVELAMLLGRLERLHEAFVTELGRRHGLTASELRVLAVLAQAAEPVRPTRIGEWLVQTSGGVTATLRRLDERGLIDRSEDEQDRRVRGIRITPEGAARYEAAFTELLASYEDLLRGVDVPVSLGSVRALVQVLERQGGAASSAAWHPGPR
jgi:DNA-binding MarR family transcriptional regulator